MPDRILVTSMSALAGGWSFVSTLLRQLDRSDGVGCSFSGRCVNEQTCNSEILIFSKGYNVLSFENVEARFSNVFMNDALLHLLKNLVRFSEHQSTCRAWFVLRAFKFTSRTSGEYLSTLHVLSKNSTFLFHHNTKGC